MDIDKASLGEIGKVALDRSLVELAFEGVDELFGRSVNEIPKNGAYRSRASAAGVANVDRERMVAQWHGFLISIAARMKSPTKTLTLFAGAVWVGSWPLLAPFNWRSAFLESL